MNSASLPLASSGGTTPPLGSSVDPAGRQVRERRRARARAVRQGLLVLLLLGAAVAAVLSLRPEPVPVDVVQVARGPLVVAIQETGQTRVKDRYVISAPTTGHLSRLRLEPGDAVREGDVLAELSPTLSPLLDARTRAENQARLGAALSAVGRTQAEVARAATAKKQTERELDRARILAASGTVPAQNLEQAEFAARIQSAALESAEFAAKVASEEARLAQAALRGHGSDARRDGHLDVLAPASGHVLRVYQPSAGVVQAGTPLLEVGDLSALEGVVDLITTDAVHVRPGTPAQILGWGGEQSVPGRVLEIEPSAFTRPSALGVDEQRVNVIIDLGEPRAEWAMLGDGYHIEARLTLWQGDQVNKLPLGAVFRHGGGWASFVVEGGRARLRPVTVGHRGETEVEIVTGVSGGETVVVHPGDRVKDGARVEAE